MYKIEISKTRKGTYGQEYMCKFMKDGKIQYKVVCFARDLKDIKKAYTKAFEKATVIRKYLKKK